MANTTIYDPSVTCAEFIYYGMGMCLTYKFGSQEWELLTRTTKTGLARYRRSTFPAPTAPTPTTFPAACEFAMQWLRDNCVRIWADDRERMTETAANYLR